ncbi:MAG: hypothetical protein L0211_01815 [Planctomycetaceae bacterium]|nr:hypothetical protein [Planctomycetaceae bacterium]
MPMDKSSNQPPRRRWGFRFSLGTLMALMLAVAMYFAGRASVTHRYALAPALAGDWQAKLPAGFVQPTTLQDFGEGRFQLRSQASIFNGLYEWRRGRLVAVEPTDTRMIGLEWKWDGTKLTLVAEPKNTPTGSSYVGTVLTAAPPKAGP